MSSYRPVLNLPLLQKIVENAVVIQKDTRLPGDFIYKPFKSDFRKNIAPNQHSHKY